MTISLSMVVIMKQLLQEISTDYDLECRCKNCDPSSEIPDLECSVVQDLKDLDAQARTLDNLETQLYRLQDVSSVISSYGLTASGVELLKSTSLMTTTALESLGITALAANDQADATKAIALEALAEDARAKAAEWSAKVVAAMVNGAKAIMTTLDPLFTKVTEMVKTLGEKTWDGAKFVGSAIKAHPYKTILIALTAAIAVVGIMSFVGTGFSATAMTNGALTTSVEKLTQLYRGIKWPFGKIKTTVTQGGLAVKATIENTAATASSMVDADKAGWTTSTIKAVSSQTKTLYTLFTTAMKPVWENVIKPTEKVVSGVAFMPKIAGEQVFSKTGARSARWATEYVLSSLYYPILRTVVTNVYTFVRDIVVKTVEMIITTFRNLSRKTEEA